MLVIVFVNLKFVWKTPIMIKRFVIAVVSRKLNVKRGILLTKKHVSVNVRKRIVLKNNTGVKEDVSV